MPWSVQFEPDVKGSAGIAHAIYSDAGTRVACSFRVDPTVSDQVQQFYADCAAVLAKTQSADNTTTTVATTLAVGLNK